MRTKLIVLILLKGCLFANMQVLAQDVTPEKPPAYSSNVPRSYVRSWVAAAPSTDPNAVIAMDVRDAKQSTAYVDGLGRLLQTVLRKGSYESNGTATDLVTARVYDAFGREVRKYLPFSASDNSRSFKLDPFEQQKTFYDVQLAGQGESFYYSKTDREAAPSGRQTKLFAEGNSWVNEGRAAQSLYYTNTPTDDVKKWSVTDLSWDWASYTVTGVYGAGELFKRITVDEGGKQIIEFRDKDNLLVLKKIQLTAAADNGSGSNYAGWLCTYFIYDHLDNLRCVVQPAGVELLIGAGWNITAYNDAILKEQCFRYEYDERNRLSRKKVPGGGETWMVYDQWDRLVLVQDANLRQQGKWIFTKYDHLNRQIVTGFYTYLAFSQSSMQQHVNSQNLARYENYNPASFPVYSLNLSFPQVTMADVLTITYYDDYSWTSWYGNYGAKDNSYDSYFTTGSSYPYPESLTQSTNVKGLVTGVWDVSSKLVASYYDQKGRVIQTKTHIPEGGGGVEVLTTQYNFLGKVLQTVLYHPKNGDNAQTHLVITKMNYDDAGRLVSVRKSVTSSLQGGVTINKPEVEILKNEYDKLGQLKHKNLGKKKDAAGNYTTTPLETLTYDYNIRGWMLGMNRDQVLTSNGTSARQFGFEVGYNKVNNKTGRNFTAPLFNGNITGIVWKSNGDGIRRKYDFTYDNTNRLLQAAFEQNDESTNWSNNLVNYSIKMGDGVDVTSAYDANGNIKRMQQWGLKLTGSTQIDDMVYTYYDYSNKLKAVTEQGPGAADHKLADFTDNSTTANDYGYDKSGNLITDLNRRLNGSTGLDLTSGGAISYNHFNLPAQITVKDNNGNQKGTISYVYDGFGRKLKKISVEDPSAANGNRQITTTTYYMGNFVYESKTYNPAHPDNPNYSFQLQYIEHDDGRVRFKPAQPGSPASLEHDYFIRDQVGNIRMVLTDEQSKTVYPAATLEGSQTPGQKSMINFEKKFYTVNNSYVFPKTSIPSWTSALDYENNNGNPPPNNSYPSDHTFNPTGISDNLYKLNATTNKTGLGFVIKVMAGDRIDIHGKSYYHSNQTFNNGNSTPLVLADILGAFLGTPNNPAAAKGVSVTQLEGWNSGINGIPGSFIRGSNGESVNVPKAYINFILFDDQFRYAGGNFSRAGTSGGVKSHWFQDASLQNIPVTKNGYLYVYVSNESNTDVFFDNLQVIHTKGVLLEETHYYPFGLTMAGISSKLLTTPYAENKKGYNGNELQNKEFSDGSGLEFYDFNARTFDQQIGRFIQIDPDCEEGAQEDWSPYHFGYNNPARYGDPDGKLPIFLAVIAVKFVVGAAIEYGSQVYENSREGKTGLSVLAPRDGWRGYAKIAVNGITSTVDPSGGIAKRVIISTATNVVESVANQAIDGKQISLYQTAKDVVIMTASSKVKVENTEELARKYQQYDRQLRIAENNPKPSRFQKAEEMKQKADNANKRNAAFTTATTETTEAYMNKKTQGLDEPDKKSKNTSNNSPNTNNGSGCGECGTNVKNNPNNSSNNSSKNKSDEERKKEIPDYLKQPTYIPAKVDNTYVKKPIILQNNGRY